MDVLARKRGFVRGAEKGWQCKNSTFQPIQGELCENLLRDAVDAVHGEDLQTKMVQW
jgi:hypothetical protein